MSRRSGSLPRTRGQWVIAVVATLVAIGFWLWQGQGATPATGGSGAPRTPVATATQSHSDSGLPTITVGHLPDEAAQTLELIDAGGPFPYDRDGVVFGNFEGLLPQHPRGYYHEYTVPTPGEDDRGARRIVTGGPGEYYWTGDHYQSFQEILR